MRVCVCVRSFVHSFVRVYAHVLQGGALWIEFKSKEVEPSSLEAACALKVMVIAGLAGPGSVLTRGQCSE